MRTVRRHHHHHHHHHRRRIPIWVKILLGILILLLVLTGTVYIYARYSLGKINTVKKQEEVRIDPKDETFEIDEGEADAKIKRLSPEEIKWPDMETDILQDKDVVNIMLIGQDRREGESRQRSDTMILATINKKKNTLQMTSFMRDLYVQIPGYSDNRMNAAYQFGGMELLDEVVEKNFGIHVDGNVEVDFDGFQKCIDMLGGIDLELTQEEADFIAGRSASTADTDYDWQTGDLRAGVNHLTGEQALKHARNRSIGNSDYTRTERQRAVLAAVFRKAKAAKLSTMLSLVDQGFSLLTTDLTHGEIMGYAFNVLMMGVDHIDSYRVPQDGASTPAVIRGMQVLVPDLVKCREYLKENLY